MRSAFLILTAAAAYALLRGWPEALHPLLRACFAVLFLVLGLGSWHRRTKPAHPRARSLRSPGLPDYVAMGLGILGIECLFLFVLAAAPPKAEQLAAGLEEVLRPEAAAARRAELGDLSTRGGPPVGNWLWDSQGRRPLPRNLTVQPSNKPEVFLRPEDAETRNHFLGGRPYIRAFALEVYEDGMWAAHPVTAETLVAKPDGRIDLPQPPTRRGRDLRCEIYHAAHPAGQDVLTTIQGALEIDLPRVRRIAPDIYRLDPISDPSSGYEYRCVSRPLTLDDMIEHQFFDGIEAPSDAPEHLLALPENPALRDALISIAVRTQGPLDMRLVALRKFLRDNCTYSLSISDRDGVDPLENFLFHEREGHCEFFATAGALLARSLGIPSRVAYGWTGGRFFPSQNLVMFRAREAHAWTELYFEGTGWVIFDTTPPDAVGAAASSLADRNENIPIGEDGLFDFDEGDGLGGTLGIWPWLAFGTGVGALPFACLLLGLRRRPVRSANPEAIRLLPDPPGYLARFKQACSRRGHPMPPARTLRRHLQHLSSKGIAPSFGPELLDYHYGTTYGNDPPDRSREKTLQHEIASWAAP